MSNYHIGLSGLNVAQRAIELVGANIANASTEGYHKQILRTAPMETGGHLGGVEIVDVHRTIDRLMEREMLLQQPQMGQNSQELASLRLIENSLGDLDNQGLTLALDKYFNSLSELSAQPTSQALRYEVVWSANALADQCRHVGSFLTDLKGQAVIEAGNQTEQANNLIANIGWLNGQIRDQLGRGQSANALLDSRDQAILELGELLNISTETSRDATGMVNVQAWGTPIVTGTNTTELETGFAPNGLLGVSVKGGNYYQTDISGGKVGGLLTIQNSILAGISDDLDALANTIITETNKVHAQGVGEAGSFTELTGWPVSSEKLSEWNGWNTDLQAGVVNIRITDQSASTTTLHQLTVDGDSTAAGLAASLDALTGLDADIVNNALQISSADPSQYTFDFLPESVLDTATNPWTGTAQPAITGIYDGTSNDAFTFTVTGTGSAGDSASVSITDGLSIEVRNGSSELVKRVPVGLGYAAGDTLDLGIGLKIALPTGTIKLGEQFGVTAVAESDSSGFLAAARLNSFFTGSGALDMGVRDDLLANPSNMAASATAVGSDNINALRMAQIADSDFAALNGNSPADFFRRVVTGIGQDIAFRQARQDSLEAAMMQLQNERDSISGVDINEEAAKLLVYEQMYQAVAKFMSTQSEMLEYLARII